MEIRYTLAEGLGKKFCYHFETVSFALYAGFYRRIHWPL
jgi:hypothetical protein